MRMPPISRNACGKTEFTCVYSSAKQNAVRQLPQPVPVLVCPGPDRRGCGTQASALSAPRPGCSQRLTFLQELTH